MFRKLTIFALAAAVWAPAAMAHPKLVSAAPAANAAIAPTTRIVLNFSEKLTPQFSGAELVMTGMPGMKDHPPMKMSGAKSSVGPDGKSLLIVMARPLPVGTYRVDYHVVSADTHRINGTHVFSVK